MAGSRVALRSALERDLGADRVGGEGAALVRARSVEEVATVVRLAGEAGGRVWPRGGGTRISPAPDADVVLDLSGLTEPFEHHPEDLVASIGAGLPFARLGRQLAAAGQRLPLDPAAAPTSTLGGVLATDASGPLRLTHGTIRDRVLGVTAVRFDGRIVRAGGMVVKNVSGYDVAKLLVGSRGSLAVVVSVNLKLDPLPELQRSVTLEAQTREQAWRLVDRLRRDRAPLASAVWRLDGTLSLGLEGRSEIVEEAATSLEGDVAEAGSFVPPTGERRVRVHLPPAAWVSAMPGLADGASEAALVGAGVSWLTWDGEGGEAWADRVRSMRAALAPAGGWLEVERGASVAAPRIVVGAAELALMRGLEGALDPDGVFPDGPGREVAG